MSRFITILAGATTTGQGPSTTVMGRENVRTYQAVLTGTGTPLSATVKIQGSVDNVHWVDLTTFNLTDAAPTAGFTSIDAWAYVVGNVTAISGAGAAVALTLAT